jgi:mannose-6-phosphate isomerase-like protein (cupin superfamily)
VGCRTLSAVPELLEPTTVPAGGGKDVAEYVGRVNTDDGRVSLARMNSPAGWSEPGQRPEFEEFTLVLAGELVVEHGAGRMTVGPGQAVRVRAGEWVRYSSPGPSGADYLSVCLPAFAPDTVHRDPE